MLLRIGTFLLISLAALTYFAFSAAMVLAQNISPIRISVNGNMAETDVPPFIDGNFRTMVPVRFISEALGSFVGWDEITQQIRISRPGTLVELQIGKQGVLVNGTTREMDTTAVLKNGRTMVPLRFLAETLGLNVAWKQEERTVAINTMPHPTPPSPAHPAPALRYCTVSGSIVNIRSGAGTDYSRLAQVARGTRLTILAEKDAWYLVQLPDGLTGWIAGWLVELKDAKPSGEIGLRGDPGAHVNAVRSALVMKNSVNIRTAPDITSSVVARATLGQQLPVSGEQNGWFAVTLPDGQNGWIAGWLIAVRYDSAGQIAAAGFTRSAQLPSRNVSGGQTVSGPLPLLTSMALEQSDHRIILRLKVDTGTVLAQPNVFRLSDPSRLVFDFQALLASQVEAPALNQSNAPVSSMRVSMFNEQTVRIVADLRNAVTYTINQIPDGMEIIIQDDSVVPTGMIIVIDPGHGTIHQTWGISDPGAIGPTGLKEREVVKSISQKLGNILLNEGFSVIYTRKGNTELTLEDRALVAGISGAELLVSIHANASTNRSVAGTMTFYHAPLGAEYATLMRSHMALASFIHTELLNRLQREDKGVREADFLLLRSASVPAALLELAYISNLEEEKLLADPAFQRRSAEAIAIGIKRFLATR